MFPQSWGFGYKLTLFLHILSVIVAFAPGFVWPVVSAQLKKAGKPVGPAIGGLAEGNTKRVHGPALVLVGLFGFSLVMMSTPVGQENPAWGFDQFWVIASLLLWFIIVGLVFGMMLPAERRAAQGDQGAEKIISAVGGGLHLLLALTLVLMIWKPGL